MGVFKKMLVLLVWIGAACPACSGGSGNTPTGAGETATTTTSTTTTTSPTPIEWGEVTDVEGNVYRTVRIGEQWWMAENLRVTSDPQGNPITSYAYNNEQSTAAVYGRLYTWGVAMNGSTEERSRGIAPEGWHIPNDGDWNVLLNHLGGINVAGGLMKEAATVHWNPPNTGATNDSGFTGLPGGGYHHGLFEGLGIGGHFWSSTESGQNAGLPTLHYESASVLMLQEPKTIAASIRCVRN
jgi:uncharacterized protein (TIGR02145 family)